MEKYPPKAAQISINLKVPPRRQKQADAKGGYALEKDLAAGAIVPLRSAAFRSTALRPFAHRKLRGSLHLPCPLHLPGLLHCPPHLLVSLLSVDLPHLLQPLLQHRVLESVPVFATITVIHCESVPPHRLTRPFLRPFPLLEKNSLLDPPGPAQRYCGSNQYCNTVLQRPSY